MSLDGFQPENGNRAGLTFQELELLENTILPKAREWLKKPGLADHAKQTLAYWGEQP